MSPTDARDATQGDKQRDPWRAYVAVAQIPDTGLHRDIEAGQSARQAMAEVAGLREVAYARASFDMRHGSGGQVHVAGRVQARIGQTCVVTLDPLDTEINETVDLIFAPAGQTPPEAEFVDDDSDSASRMEDPPEPIVDGVIDLGRLATDVLFLAIDPYPRKEGAVFEPQVTATDPEDHPFAALKAFRIDPDKQGEKKPKDK
jgi:hypothetical protein